MSVSAGEAGGWRRTGAAASSALGGGGLVLLGLLLGRPDVVVLGAPLLLGLAWASLRRPVGPGSIAVVDAHQRGDGSRVEATVALRPPPGSVTTLLRVGAPGHRARDVLVGSSRPRDLRVAVSGVRTGRREAFAVVHQEASHDSILRTEPVSVGPVSLVVLPRPAPLGPLPLPPRLQGLTGGHVSRRVGDGGDLHDVAPFAPGDRLRRIDWPVTLRQSARGATPGAPTVLHVRRTLATADAVVLLVLDSRDDVGPDVGTWSGAGELHPDDATSLDVARQAAASLARACLDAGDRVGLVDLGTHRPPLRPAAGRRHLLRVVHALAVATPSGEVRSLVRAPQIPSGVLVVVLSTFLDDQAASIAAMWRRAGHRVLAVDVLPPPRVEHLAAAERNAFRVVQLEREDRLWGLGRAGVELLPWTPVPGGGRSLTVGLATLSRRRDRRR